MTNIPGYLTPGQGGGDPGGSGGRWALRLIGPFVWGWAALLFAALVIFLGQVILPVPADWMDFAPWLTLLPFPGLGSWLGLLAGVFLVAGVTYAARSNRKARALAILSYSENAVRLNLPLGPFIRAAAQSERRATRRRLLRLAQGLDSGAPLGDVLKRSVPEIHAHVATAVGASERVGQLGPTLSRLLGEQINEPSPGPTLRDAVVLYPLVICFAALTVVTSLAIFVLPQYEEIFKDFKGEVPEFTQRIVGVPNYLVSSLLFIPLCILAFLILLFVLGRGLRFIFSPWWPSLIVSPLARRLSWHVPFWGALQRYRAWGDVCHFLADALRAGVPFPDALVNAQMLHLSSSVRHRILNWRTAILAGVPIPAAAASARVPAIMFGFLSTSQLPGKTGDPDALAGALEFLGRYYETRFSRLAVTLAAVIQPLITLCLGFLVAAVVIAFFLPLVAAINQAMTYLAKDVL